MLLGATIGTHDHVYKWQTANIDVQAYGGGGGGSRMTSTKLRESEHYLCKTPQFQATAHAMREILVIPLNLKTDKKKRNVFCLSKWQKIHHPKLKK